MEQIKVGSIVKPTTESGEILRCGMGMYDFAIVISVNPFILVSDCTTMMWSCTVNIEDYYHVGKADDKHMLECVKRDENIEKIYLRDKNIDSVLEL
tara:strand:- start:2674 stop:2961 length:288 start_codon:yes stop_codon:yes gene_type:complete